MSRLFVAHFVGLGCTELNGASGIPQLFLFWDVYHGILLCGSYVG